MPKGIGYSKKGMSKAGKTAAQKERTTGTGSIGKRADAQNKANMNGKKKK